MFTVTVIEPNIDRIFQNKTVHTIPGAESVIHVLQITLCSNQATQTLE